jgi:hypothetical protein
MLSPLPAFESLSYPYFLDFVFLDPDYYESSWDCCSSPSPFASIIAFIYFSLSAFLATF